MKINRIHSAYGHLFILCWVSLLETVDISCQHFGVTGVRWRWHSGGLRWSLRAGCLVSIPLRGQRGRRPCALSGRNISGECTPRHGSRAPTGRRAVKSKRRYLCKSVKETLQQAHTYLLLTSYSGLYEKIRQKIKQINGR